MSFVVFLSEAVLISLSGVMAPGPITAVAIGRGSRSFSAGPLVAIGHGLVEFPVIAAVSVGVGRLLHVPWVSTGIGLAGSVILAVMGVSMLRSLRSPSSARGGAPALVAGDRSPLVAGVLLSMVNPYFLIWWATIGAALISQSLAFGLLGLAAFAVAHWLCDLLWCSFLSTLSFRGGRFFGGKAQEVVFAICGGALIFFAGRLLLQSVGVL